MTLTQNRYPGAQPFSDNEYSRRIFFGREQASIALTDQILANRLVVIYAKSGLGKSSLLNAGVAPRLREASQLPLFIRLNDVQRDPAIALRDGVREEAKRQGVEYVAGEGDSLWAFFKSAEFWRGDLLLTPVLILDQFEELFTLHADEVREKFLAELGPVIRGVPPASVLQAGAEAAISPPALHVVLSLREDFLGILEEGSDHIPQILDHRFRLTPLTCEMASEAIMRPAVIEDPGLATRPFRLDPALVTVILNYLAKAAPGARASSVRHIEPFHLQLICQRIEKVVALKQQRSGDVVVLNFNDFGGEAALSQTLVNFYKEAVQSVPAKYMRPAVRRLCEEYLISPEGRRLSLEERELQRQLKLPHAALNRLVDARLLRTDRRSDSTYYELSHDALVEPVLASRRMRALVVGWAALLAGSIIFIASFPMAVFAFCFAIYGIFKAIGSPTSPGEAGALAAAGLLLVSTLVLTGIALYGIQLARKGLARRARYGRHSARDLSERLPTLLPLKQRVMGWTLVGIGSALLGLWTFVGVFFVISISMLAFTHGRLPTNMESTWTELKGHPLSEPSWIAIRLWAALLFGWIIFRPGARKLWPHTFRSRSAGAPVAGIDQPAPYLATALRFLIGAGALVLTIAVLRAFVHCSRPGGSMPNWFPPDVAGMCSKIRTLGWKKIQFDGVWFLLAPAVITVAFLPDGIRDGWRVLRYRRLTRAARESQPARVA